MVIDTGHDRTRWLAMAALGVYVWSWREQNSILSVSTLGPVVGMTLRTSTRPSTAGRCFTARAQEMVTKMTISADNFWIELDRLLGASATTAAQMEALMERYGRV